MNPQEKSPDSNADTKNTESSGTLPPDQKMNENPNPWANANITRTTTETNSAGEDTANEDVGTEITDGEGG